MKKIIFVICAILTLSLVSCVNNASTEDGTDSAELSPNGIDGALLDLDGVESFDVSSLSSDDSYIIADHEELNSYFEQPYDNFLGVCKHYSENGWTLYSFSEKNKNSFATYVNGASLAHIYWIECEEELNIITSETGGSALPPQNAETAGGERISVTQLMSSAVNGMGYVIKLADGTFIVYDGGGKELAPTLWDALSSLNGGEDGIVIRAWIITHSHADHYPCFGAFADRYGDKVRLETVMISPTADSDAQDTYLTRSIEADVAKYSGAKLLYVHTGMTFRYCGASLEILFTANELYISDPKIGDMHQSSTDFNNSSIVSRIYTDTYSALFLADAVEEVAVRMALYYGDYLQSDMCQISHHGVEDFPLIVYRKIKASTLWYPCNTMLYNLTDRDAEVREAMRKSRYTKEIILHDSATETRYFE